MKSKIELIHFVAVLGCLSVKTIGQDTPQTPSNFTANSTATSIHLNWTQPQDDLVVDSFEINYTFTINECGSVGGDFPSVTIPVSDGTLSSYTIMNSLTTPVEENSVYTIMLTAISNGTRSSPATRQTTTETAAPGPPPSLTASSVGVTNITIQWDSIPCQDRNQRFDMNFLYRVTYHPLSDQTAGGAGFVSLMSSREFTALGLPPRTSYIFRVQAFNSFTVVRGSLAELAVNTSEPQDLGFLLNGQLYPNNSVVTVADIGSSFFTSALFCLTPSLECCSDSETPNAASVTREWYLPNGRAVSSAGTVVSREQVSSAVSLYRSGGTAPSGVFRCGIPDASGTSQNIYVGIYPEGDGSPSIISLLFDRNSTTLTCISNGGPPTTVTWMVDGTPVNSSLYEQSQRLVNAEAATYENILFNDDIARFVGTFTCEVSNVRGRVAETTELNGVSIIREQFNVGDNATTSCISDNQATRMEWLNNGEVVETAILTQQLDLEFSPVNDSIHNQVYVCRVTREGDVQVEQNFTVGVDVPPDAITTSVTKSDIARAGMIYNLTCTVSKTVDGLINSPTATWTTGGVAVSNGNGIIVSTMTTDTANILTLTFDPLRTSHDGRYICSGTLTSRALQMERRAFIEERLSVQISTPDVVITVPPGPLFAGTIDPLTLICNIFINPATDITITATTVDVVWSDDIDQLTNSTSRVTISPLSGSELSYTSTLTLSPPNAADSTFICGARARPPPRLQSFITSSEEGRNTTNIVVEDPFPPVVSITFSSDSVTAGEPLTLTCSASLQEGIRGTPTLTWTREGFDNLPSEVTSAPPLLTFPTLHTSHGGQYICTARLSIPEAGVDVSGTKSANVSIQIPQPSITISGSPRNMTFLPGLVETFTCVVEVHPAVDTAVMVRGNWKRNGTVLQTSGDGRISVANEFETVAGSSNRYQIVVTFNPMTFDENGIYQCSAIVSPQNFGFVSHTMLASSQRTVYVQALPPPTVTVASRQPSADGCGEARILNCTTELMEGFITAPSISWIAPDGTPVSTDESANPRLDSQTRQLIFSSISTANFGLYMCCLGVGDSFEAFAGVDVDAELPGMPQNLVCAKSSRPSDLTFSWDSPTSQRNEIVGYRVDVKGLSHRDGTGEVIQNSVATFTTPIVEANLTRGLAAEVPYIITVKALNLAGCGQEQQIYCFTLEGQELPVPENVRITGSNTTSIEISWKRFTLVELKALANYTVTYSASTSDKRQTTNTIHVPWTEDGITITNLIPGTRYDITVSITTLSGMSEQVQTSGSTRSLPSQMNSLPIIIGVVVALAIVLIIILIMIILIVVLVTMKRRRATLKLEKTRMLRAFEQPADIMLTSKENASVDEKEEEEDTTANELQEKPLPASTGECELVQTPVHVPTTFTAPKESTDTTQDSPCTAQVNGNSRS